MTESEWSPIPMTPSESGSLLAAGRALAQGTNRYGVTDEASTASLVHMRGHGPTTEVRVLDAVGLLAIPSLHIHVRPKIPVAHLIYILERAQVLPRFGFDVGSLDVSDNLATLVAHWFVTAAERVLEEGLARDYRDERDVLTSVRGRLLVLDTARLYYRGQPAVVADYEEYDYDTPLNRLIAHAARLIAAGTALPDGLRRRALRVAKRMDGVGIFRPSDALARTDRRTSYYEPGRELAVQIIKSTGRTLGAGEARSWTFLFRTPGPVQSGMTALIAAAISPSTTVRAEKRWVSTGNLTINPDLVFRDTSGVRAVGDIKYKLAKAEWDRGDLYEVTAFAAGFGVGHALIAQFSGTSNATLSPVQVGPHLVSQVTWPIGEGVTADNAATAFAEGVREWLDI